MLRKRRTPLTEQMGRGNHKQSERNRPLVNVSKIFMVTHPPRNYSCLWAQNLQLNILNSRVKQVKFGCLCVLCSLLLYFAPFAAYILFKGVNIHKETGSLKTVLIRCRYKANLSFLKYLSDW